MKICATSTGLSLDAPVDPRFGRCQYFMVVDSETMEYDAMQNPRVCASGSAGIQVAQTVAGKGVDVVGDVIKRYASSSSPTGSCRGGGMGIKRDMRKYMMKTLPIKHPPHPSQSP